MSDYDNTNTGAMFPNTYKEDGDKRPDHTGNLNVDGKEFKIAAWQSTSKAGNDYLSVRINEPEMSDSSSDTDEIPF